MSIVVACSVDANPSEAPATKIDFQKLRLVPLTRLSNVPSYLSSSSLVSMLCPPSFSSVTPPSPPKPTSLPQLFLALVHRPIDLSLTTDETPGEFSTASERDLPHTLRLRSDLAEVPSDPIVLDGAPTSHVLRKRIIYDDSHDGASLTSRIR